MALSSIRIFAGTLVPIAMCIRLIKMVVSENPPGGAWGATVAIDYSDHLKDREMGCVQGKKK